MKKILLVLLAAPFLASAQIANPRKLDAYLDTLSRNSKLMGTLAVAKDGEVIYSKMIGLSDVERRTAPVAATRYRIGSISKTFTAAMMLKAVAQNRITLSTKLSDYFPDFPKSQNITMEMLLRHNSGIHNFTDDADYMTWHTKAHGQNEMLAQMVKRGFDFEPGVRHDYSNSNYVLLSYVLEKVYKKPFGQLLQAELAKPLLLKNTSLSAESPAANEARSYEYSNGWTFVPFTHVSVPMGAGGMVSTAEDLLVFLKALFGGKIVSEALLAQMKTTKGGFGMGLFEIPFYEHKGFGHTGGIDGFASVFAHFPDSGISYAFISNGHSYNTNDVSIAVLSAVFDKPYDIPQFVPALPAEALSVYLGTYSSSGFPLKITVTQKGATLIAQATGQPSFPLEPTIMPHVFKFDSAGLSLEFNPEKQEMTLKQGGGVYVLQRE